MRRGVACNGISGFAHRVASLVFISWLASACTATAPVNEPSASAAAPPQRAEEEPLKIEAPASPCAKSPYRVRDLTVPWTQRTYLVAPCPARGVNPSSTPPLEATAP